MFRYGRRRYVLSVGQLEWLCNLLYLPRIHPIQIWMFRFLTCSTTQPRLPSWPQTGIYCEGRSNNFQAH